MTTTTQTVKARTLTDDAILADGAIVLTLSFQLDWVYATVVKPATARVTVRRYRYDQDVKVEVWS